MQRRLADSDLKEQLGKFISIFGREENTTESDIQKSMNAYVYLSVLIRNRACDLNAKLVREVLKEFLSQRERINNIIKLARINADQADEYQKKTIEKTLNKNEKLMEGIDAEIRTLKAQIDSQPVMASETTDKKLKKERKTNKKLLTFEEKPVEKTALQTFGKNVSEFVNKIVNKKRVEEELREEEKKSSITLTEEIAYYDRNLRFEEKMTCRYLPGYILIRRKNSYYFGREENAGQYEYDNYDGSLLELTNVTEEFVVFMTDDVLSLAKDANRFSEAEKYSLRLYFDFMCRCFEKNIGVTLSVQDYMAFKIYYNKLANELLELEERNNKRVAQAESLARKTESYLQFYNSEAAYSYRDLTEDILSGDVEVIVQALRNIDVNHLADKSSKRDIRFLMESIIEMSEGEEEE